MKNIIGPPVSGDDFKFREKNLRKATRLLSNRSSFLILGIRRTGKSSFLKQCAHLLRAADKANVCIELDCQTYNHILDFYKGLYNEMPKPLKVRFKKFMNDSKQLPSKLIDSITGIFDSVEAAGVKVDFNEKLSSYAKPFEELVTAFFKSTDNVYLFLHEVPFFFENIGEEAKHITEITQILSNLRSWRHAGLSIGMTGSLNLHQQLEHLGISRKLLAGLNTIELDPFTYEESKNLINDLLRTDKHEWWNDEVTETLLSLVPDYVPYFIQYCYNEVSVHQCTTKQAVEEVYHNEITSGLFKDFIYQFDERLKVFKGNELMTAMSILDVIALNEDIQINDLTGQVGEVFDYQLLVKLIDYEFVKISGNQEYSFTLQIIKNWWITKRSLNK